MPTKIVARPSFHVSLIVRLPSYTSTHRLSGGRPSSSSARAAAVRGARPADWVKGHEGPQAGADSWPSRQGTAWRPSLLRSSTAAQKTRQRQQPSSIPGSRFPERTFDSAVDRRARPSSGQTRLIGGKNDGPFDIA